MDRPSFTIYFPTIWTSHPLFIPSSFSLSIFHVTLNGIFVYLKFLDGLPGANSWYADPLFALVITAGFHLQRWRIKTQLVAVHKQTINFLQVGYTVYIIDEIIKIIELSACFEF